MPYYNINYRKGGKRYSAKVKAPSEQAARDAVVRKFGPVSMDRKK